MLMLSSVSTHATNRFFSPHRHHRFLLFSIQRVTKILNNNMNPFQFKSSIFSLSRFAYSPKPSGVFVVALYKYCVLEDGKCLLPARPPTPLARALTGMETGFRIMGNSENIGSNIIFSPVMAKAEDGREKKLARQQNGIIIRKSAHRPGGRESKKKAEARTSTVYRGEKKLFVGEFCYSHYSTPLSYNSFFLAAASRLGFVGSKLFSESRVRGRSVRTHLRLLL